MANGGLNVVKNATKQDFIFDYLALNAVLLDLNFYDVPVLASFKEEGRAMQQRVAELQHGQRATCRFGCSRMRKLLIPFLSDIGLKLTNASQVDQEAMCAFVEQKWGYRPEAVILYYKGADGRTIKLKLQPAESQGWHTPHESSS